MALRPDPNHIESPTADGAAFGRQRTVRVVVGTHLDELVARKTGTNPAAIVAVEREALVLGQLRHPNVVDLVRAEHGDGSATIVTQYAGPTTLEQERPGDAADVARTGAALLTVVGELHSMGWIHGRLRAEHCIVGDDGRLTLCALGAAHRIEPRDPRRGAEVGDAIQIISMLAERVPAPIDRAGRRRLRQLHAALAAAGDDRSPASVERLRVSLTRLSGSVAVAGTRTDASTTRPSNRARARLRRDDTTRASAVLPQRRSWRGALVATAGLAVLFGGVVFLRWVGGPLGLDGDVSTVRRLGDLPPALLAALNIVRVTAFAACLYGIALFAATLAAILTRRGDVERLVTNMAPPRLRRALVGLIGLGVMASVATGPGATSERVTIAAAPAPATTSTSTTSSTSTTTSTSTTSSTSTTTPTTTEPTNDHAPPAAGPTIPADPAPIGTTDTVPTPQASAPIEDLPNLWVMGPGDHLWRVAEVAMTNHLGRPAANHEIDGYWRRLVALNRESLIDPDNPDLVFSGQVIELPPFL